MTLRRTFPLSALVALALTGAACGGGSSSSSSNTVATRPSGTVSTVANNTGGFDTPPTTTAANARKSQPYWVPLTTLTGSGNTTTKSFTVDDASLQWRVSWHCDTAPFSVVSVNAAGQESKRKLADALTC